jgi:hypothetical protein
MTVTHVGSTDKYSQNWGDIFTKSARSAGKKSASKNSKKTPGKSAKKAGGKKSRKVAKAGK